MDSYICINCASRHGQPAEHGSENWFWRPIAVGKLGPFCSRDCMHAWRVSDAPLFSLNEWERLYRQKWHEKMRRVT